METPLTGRMRGGEMKGCSLESCRMVQFGVSLALISNSAVSESR